MANFPARIGQNVARLMFAGLLVVFAGFGQIEAPGQEKPPTGPVPEFSSRGGVFPGRVTLRLTTPTPGATIRYTLDGSEPTEKSRAYLVPIELRAPTLVRARVVEVSGQSGPVVTQSYTPLTEDAQKFTGNLPLIIINSLGVSIEHVNKTRASVRLIDTTNGVASLLGTPDFDGRADVWYRGKSSLRYPKRSYGLKLRDETGKPRPASVLGFPKESDWILYAPYPDKTLLRDVVAYELSNQIGRYASRTRFVEVFVNEGGGPVSLRDYMGVFVLEEKVKRGTNRVNIAKLGTNDNAEPNISGGYIVKKDHMDESRNVEPSWDGRPNFGGGNSGSRYGYPTGPGGFPGDPRGFLPPTGGSRDSARGWENSRGPQPPAAPPDQPEQRSWVRSLFGGDNNPPPGGPDQPDFNNRSRRRDPVIIWDAATGNSGNSRSFDEAFYTLKRNEFIYVEPEADELTRAQKNWLRAHLNEFERVLYGPNFRDPTNGYAAFIDAGSFIDHHLLVETTKNIDGFRFSTYYSKDRGGKIKMEPIWDWNLSFGNANGKQGQIAEYWYWPQLDDSQYSYFRRLFEDPDFAQRYVDRYAELRAGTFGLSNINARLDQHVAQLGDAPARNFKRWPILGRRVWPNTYVGQTYEDEINYLKEFTRKRLEWIDRQFVAAPTVSLAPASARNSGLVSLSTSVGKIHYTLDGSDPRLPGGGVSPKAQTASGTFKLPDGAKLFARAQLDGRWSAPTRR